MNQYSSDHTIHTETVTIPMPQTPTGWIRYWDSSTSSHYWKNRVTGETVNRDPYSFANPKDIPESMQHRWFEVYDEREHKHYYVNPSLQKEQWTYPLSKTHQVKAIVKAYYMEDFAKQHYNCKRSDIESLLSYNGKELRQPLLKMDSGLSRIALLINHFIHSYLKEGNIAIIQKMIALLLVSPTVITDECYCQLLKQFTHCQSQSIIDQTMEILMIVCASVLPSSELIPYIDYFLTTLYSDLKDLCSSYFSQCKQSKSRIEVPTLEEIQVLINGKSFPIEVTLLNGKCILFEISPLAQVRAVRDHLCSQLEIADASGMFQICVVHDTNEVFLEEDSRILDTVHQMVHSEYLQLSIGYYNSFDLHSSRVLNWVYYQCVHDICIGKYFHEETDYFNILALVLQQRLQDYSRDQRLLSAEITKLLPPFLKTTSTRMMSEAEIMRIYTKLKGYSQQECKLSVIEYMKGWNDYGISHFLCNQHEPIEKEEQLLGISPQGIHIGSYEKRTRGDAYTLFFPYPSITAWGISDSSISFYLDTKPSQIHYSFSVQYANDAFRLIRHYSM